MKRKAKTTDIIQAVARLCQQANFELGDDILRALKKARQQEESRLGRDILDKIIGF